jgi:hypothetical protein
MPWREGFCTLARAAVTTGRWYRPLAAADLPWPGPLEADGLSLAFGRWSRPGGL